jgi:molybdopterin molybdotransferase
MEPETAAREASPALERAMVHPDEALRLVVDASVPLPPSRVPIFEACGLVLAEPVVADRDLPPFRRAVMDGFAVRVASAGRTLEVAGEVAAGEQGALPVTEEACVEILTGAPCPRGTEAVVQKERVRRHGERVSLPSAIERGENIAEPGSECRAGQVVLGPGETLTALGVAALASFGAATVLVEPRPRVAVVITGRELAGPGDALGPARIHDSNGPMLAALVRCLGLEPPRVLRAGDDAEAIGHALEDVGDRDIIIVSGGVSVGKYDLVPKALEARGADVVFHRVRQKPGKPLLFARNGRQLTFGLPGNPLACHFCFSRYVAAAVRGLEGKAAATSFRGEILEPVRPEGGRTRFVAARAEWREEPRAGWRLRPLAGVCSADVFASAGANAYVEVPPGSEEVAAGAALRFAWMPDAGQDPNPAVSAALASAVRPDAATAAAPGAASGGGPGETPRAGGGEARP